MDALARAKNSAICVLITLLITAFLIQSAGFANEDPRRSFALELEFGMGAFQPLPLTELGSSLYGSSLSGNPFGGNIIYVFAPGVIMGINYKKLDWGHERPKKIDDAHYAEKNNVTITQVTAFMDLSPFMPGKEVKDAITKGFFVEAGPSLTQIEEKYGIIGGGKYETGEHSFNAQGIGLDIRVGYRTLTKEPLSFLVRTNISIPIAHDSKRSDTGLGLNGAVSYSFNAGFCLSF